MISINELLQDVLFRQFPFFVVPHLMRDPEKNIKGKRDCLGLAQTWIPHQVRDDYYRELYIHLKNSIVQ